MPRSLGSRLRLAVLLLGPALLLGAGLWIDTPGALRVSSNSAPATGTQSSPPAYAEHPPLGHTGGFGEPTCHACHFGGEVNGGNGTLTLEGLPESVQPGKTYRLTVTLAAEMRRTGFMLSVRHSDGSQAGSLAALDTARVGVGTPDTSAVQYAYHTLQGTTLSEPNQATWSVRWTAPTAGDSAIVHVASNAANDDASEFGDDVYTATSRVVIAQ